jgi:hypothetical protein
MALGDHLGADQHPGLGLFEATEDLGVAAAGRAV